jgi:hypothetical protein
VTTELRPSWRTGSGRALIPAALLMLSCADAHAARRGDRVMVDSYPREIQAAYRVFARRCSRCHTLARPLNAHITDEAHWVRYVTRMRRQPTSGINREDAKTILRFLLYYARELKRRDENSAQPPTQAPPAEAAPSSALSVPSAPKGAPSEPRPVPAPAASTPLEPPDGRSP